MKVLVLFSGTITMKKYTDDKTDFHIPILIEYPGGVVWLTLFLFFEQISINDDNLNQDYGDLHCL